MELKIGYEVVESYKRLSYKVWYAFAEFVDNSTQSYKNYQDILDEAYKKERTILTVEIDYSNDEDWIIIKDNSIGMSFDDLTKALTLGKKPADTTGRSKYGLGLKTSAFWFGDKWEIITKKHNEDFEYHVTVDIADLLYKQTRTDELNAIVDRELTAEEQAELTKLKELELQKNPKGKDEHYTTIKISKLNRGIHGRTVSKIREYLQSMYRYDIMEGKLILRFKGEILRWDKSTFMERILLDDEGNKYYRNFVIDVNGKKVTGWAGILETGSRKDAGFSLLQSKRVIQGWPDSYRPPSIFGDQEGGINNLVNQRLFGELFMDGFNVSHTKDEILFSDDDEDILDKNLFEVLADYKRSAEKYRKPDKDDDDDDSIDFRSMVTNLFQSMQRPAFSAAVSDEDILPQEIIVSSNEEYYSRMISSEIKDTYTANISNLKVTVILNSDSTIYEPYLVIRFRSQKDEIGILINRNHPHWKTMESVEAIFNFIKHCIYDGISEWKANWLIGSLEPETIKMIKDRLLRQDLVIN